MAKYSGYNIMTLLTSLPWHGYAVSLFWTSVSNFAQKLVVLRQRSCALQHSRPVSDWKSGWGFHWVMSARVRATPRMWWRFYIPAGSDSAVHSSLWAWSQDWAPPSPALVMQTHNLNFFFDDGQNLSIGMSIKLLRRAATNDYFLSRFNLFFFFLD